MKPLLVGIRQPLPAGTGVRPTFSKREYLRCRGLITAPFTGHKARAVLKRNDIVIGGDL